MLVLPILAASHVPASTSAKATVDKQTAATDLLAKGKADWFAMRTSSAERELIAATRTPATAAEAHYWLGRIYDFKGNKAEGAFPGFHEDVSYRPRAEAEFKAAGPAKPEWIAEGEAADNALKSADAVIAKLQSDANASAPAIRAAIEARIKLRPDPMSYAAGANMLLARKADLPFVIRLAADGKIAGERFIRENDSSYKLDGKVLASLDRNAATFADAAGWALFLQGDITGAESRLAEAARLFRNADATNQLHLAELSRKKSDFETARDHYLTALGLAGITPPQREQARKDLADVHAKSGESPAEFEKWLTATLDRKREERRKALVNNMAGKKLPALVLTDLQGHKVDLQAERGNVVLLNFFAAW
jgi:tetratricopeptide (TPR) repeat protein